MEIPAFFEEFLDQHGICGRGGESLGKLLRGQEMMKSGTAGVVEILKKFAQLRWAL
jgi:hypothetical protein